MISFAIGIPAEWTANKLQKRTGPSHSHQRAESFVDVVTLGYWRFESILASSFWRAEGILADHSGHSNHLAWSEGTDEVAQHRTVKYVRGIDSVPQDARCESDIGLGCTYLEDRGYFQNKIPDATWDGSNFSRSSFELSDSTPPFSLFNALTAKKTFLARKRDSIYKVEDRAVFPGAGNSSFDPGNLDPAGKGVLFFDHTLKRTPFNFTNDFTVEMFFATNEDASKHGEMHLLYQSTVKNPGLDYNQYTFKLSLNAMGPGTLQFSLSPNGSTMLTSVHLGNVSEGGTNYADGTWHYAVARYNREATGPSSDGYLSLKVLNSFDKSLDFAQTTVPSTHVLDSRPGYFFLVLLVPLRVVLNTNSMVSWMKCELVQDLCQKPCCLETP
jgi:hypothetical protein